ncbi:MAG: hypothetical protein JNG83_11575 [Opitutaceae bacterium]|nr:hypothetical protein [Opitutaceae bacterium]
MHPRIAAGMLAAALVLAGCRKQETPQAAAVVAEKPRPATVEVVKESERSPHFRAVTSQLELGGTLFGYADVDGDVLKVAGYLQTIFGEVAKIQPEAAVLGRQDFAEMARILGLTDIKALGLSSVPDGTGYFRNRVFVYAPGERRGLLAGLGGPPKPFARLDLAPAGTDVYSEAELDLAEIYATIRELVRKSAGEEASNLMEGALRQAGEKAAISLLGLIQGWKGHSVLVLRTDPERNLTLPGENGLTVPYFSMLLGIDGIAPALEKALQASPLLAMREEGGVKAFAMRQRLPIEDVSPVLAIEGSTLYFATSPGFLAVCLQRKGGLAREAAFTEAVAQVGAEGNGLAYVSPRFFRRFRQLTELNPGQPAEVRRVLEMMVSLVPPVDRPLVSIRTNLPEGILVRSYQNRSLKQDVAVMAVYNPASIGLMAAMAIPAFQKVRTASQEKAVLNNLRQLAAAADQYYLENGVDQATYDQLVGPDKYIRTIQAVAGEDYRNLEFKLGRRLEVTLGSGKVVGYDP